MSNSLDMLKCGVHTHHNNIRGISVPSGYFLFNCFKVRTYSSPLFILWIAISSSSLDMWHFPGCKRLILFYLWHFPFICGIFLDAKNQSSFIFTEVTCLDGGPTLPGLQLQLTKREGGVCVESYFFFPFHLCLHSWTRGHFTLAASITAGMVIGHR